MMSSTRFRQDSSGRTIASYVSPTESRGGCKRKGRHDKHNDADAPGKRQRSSEPTSTKEEGSRFQCPFFLRDPDRTDLRLACRRGLGFATISRVLEHLHRVHARLRCKRCSKTFEDRWELEEHELAAKACARRICPLGENAVVSEEKLRILSSTLRRCGGSSHQKWIEIWRFLFGDEVAAPSPHTRPETIELTRKLTETLSASIPIQIMQDFLSGSWTQANLRPLIASCVEEAVQACLGPAGLHTQPSATSPLSEEPADPQPSSAALIEPPRPPGKLPAGTHLIMAPGNAPVSLEGLFDDTHAARPCDKGQIVYALPLHFDLVSQCDSSSAGTDFSLSSIDESLCLDASLPTVPQQLEPWEQYAFLAPIDASDSTSTTMHSISGDSVLKTPDLADFQLL